MFTISNKKSMMIISFVMIGHLFASDWVDLGAPDPSEPTWDVNAISSSDLEISIHVKGFQQDHLKNGLNRISFPGSVPILEKGAPNLPRMSRSIIIPDLAHMELSIIKTEFVDIDISDVEPSKGNLTRDIVPSTVPYIYGESYEVDKFYPSEVAFLREPYILRSMRGQAVVFQPIQYNPVQRKLRIFTQIDIRVQEAGISQVNPLTRRPSNSDSRAFDHMYRDHFINFPRNDRYDILSEEGPMLVICHGDFLDEMQPFVDWKNYKGIPTDIVDVASVGDVDAMEQFIENQYYENGIAFVLLVGDIDQIESIRRSNGNGSNSPSDNSFTFVAGDDYYPDLMIGRFSAETGEHVETMVNRTIAYEMNPDPEGMWYKKGAGFASNEGPGDDGEYDNEHMDNIRDLLMAYTYDEIDQVYDPNGTVADGEVAINNGRSIINYTGHGSNGSWGNGCPMNQTDVNNLENMGMYPFIWSVACVNGEFHQGTCYAETWLRATNEDDGTPTGAIAVLMSTVNQGWNPPMEGQDEMNAILVESYSNNIKRTFGGLSFNGMNQMNDSYGTQGYNETFYWTIFGDPSVVVRSDTPTDLEINHDQVLVIGAQEIYIDAGVSGAHAAVSMDGQLLAYGHTNESGTIDLVFDPALDVPGELDLVVTAYNKIPYETSINVIAPDGAYIILDDLITSAGEDDILDFGETASFHVEIENVGQEASGDLLINLSHDGTMINVLTDDLTHTSVDPGELATVGPFNIEVGWNIDDGSVAPIIVTVSGENQHWEHEMSVHIEAPSFLILNSDLVDNGNGTLDPGESISMEITLLNTGNSPVSYPTFEATTSAPYLVIDSVLSNNAYWFDVGDEVNITIELSATNDAPVGSSSMLSMNVGSLHTSYAHSVPVPIIIGVLIDDFETGDFSSFPWIHGGETGWVIDTDGYSGNYSARSGNLSDGQTSELSMIVNVLYEGEIQFWSKSSSEQGGSGTNYDYLDFYINDQSQGLSIGGETDWNLFGINLPTGEHTLRWVYEKDDATSFGEDCAWIDRIQLPPGAVFPLDINFGDLNFDNQVNILDIIVTVNHVAGHIDLNGQQIENADMNLDGTINILDVILMVDWANSEQ